MNEKKDILSQATEAIAAEKVASQVPDEVVRATLAKLAEAGAGQVRTDSRKSILERIKLMKSSTKFAVAAILVIGVLFGINYFGGSIDGSRVVFAKVLDQVKQVQNVIYKIDSTVDGEFFAEMPEGHRSTEMEMFVMVSDEYGMKMEMFMDGKVSQVMYMQPSEGLVMTVVPEAKKYIRLELNDEEMLAKMRQESNDPRYMASEFMDSEYVELGIKEIDGVEVEGFEVTDPAAMGGMFETLNVKLWFDVDSGWPVQIEMDVTLTMGEKSMHMVMVMHDFEWDVEVDPAEFVPVIGDDYSELAMQMPKMDDGSAIEGLKMFADMAGRYPKKLNVMGIMGEMMEVKKDQGIEDGQALRAAREGMTEEEAKEAAKEQLDQYMEEKTQEMVKEMAPMMSAGAFYMKLVQEERDPVYYGETVMPGEGESVLLRWRLDSGEYQVIYGDLSQETVSAERLAELESTIVE